jgi:hypothetical protein
MDNLEEDLPEEYFNDLYELIRNPVTFNEFIDLLKKKCKENNIKFDTKNIVENDFKGSLNIFKQHLL